MLCYKCQQGSENIMSSSREDILLACPAVYGKRRHISPAAFKVGFLSVNKNILMKKISTNINSDVIYETEL